MRGVRNGSRKPLDPSPNNKSHRITNPTVRKKDLEARELAEKLARDLFLRDLAGMFELNDHGELFRHPRDINDRHVLWKLMKARGVGLARIGRVCGVSHTTVLGALRNMDKEKQEW